MAADVQPPELAQLLDLAERPRTDNWSLRAALTRYAQPQPQRVGNLLEVVRWVEFGFRTHQKAVEKDGPATWAALDAAGDRPDDLVLGMLRAMVELDRLGDVLAGWAADPSGERPDAEVDAVTADVHARLKELGVPKEERQRPPRQRG